MIPIGDLPYIDAKSGRTWDLSGLFEQIAPLVTLQLKYDRQSRHETDLGGTQQTYSHTSRSYSDDYVAEVFAEARCGIDLEVIKTSQEDWSIHSPLFERAMLAPGEKELIQASELSSHEDLATVIWAAKEALAKALGDAKNYEPSQLLSPLTWVSEPIPNWVARFQEFVTDDGQRLVLWVVAETG